MQIKEFINKLQSLSLFQKKIILWTIVIILGAILIMFWWNYTKEKLKGINPGKAIEQFIPSIEKQNVQ